jgi:hypothetical protein
MAASIVTESNQHLLETGDGHDRMGHELPCSISTNAGMAAWLKRKDTLKDHSVEHMHVVGPLDIHHWLPHKLDPHSFLKFLHIFNTPKLPLVEYLPNDVHYILKS